MSPEPRWNRKDKISTLDQILRRLLMGGLFLPLVLLTLAVIVLAGLTGGREIALRQQRLAQTLAYLAQDYIRQAERVLDSLGQVSNTWSSEETARFMDATWHSYGYFESLYRLDPDGLVVLHVPFNPDYMGIDMSYQPYFQLDQDRQLTFISKPFTSLRTGRPTVYMTHWLADGGMVVGELSLGELQKAVSVSLGELSRDTIFVADRSGTLVAHSQPNLVAWQTNVGYLSIVRRSQLEPITLIYQADGVWALSSAVRMARTGWVVVTQTPLYLAYRSYVQLIGLAAAVSLTLWLTWGWFIQQRLRQKVVTPLVQLRRQANALAAGKQDTAMLTTLDAPFAEMATLIENFAAMSRAVQLRQAALQESEQKYRLLIEQSNDAIYLLYNGKFELINLRFQELFAITPEQARSPKFDMMDLVAPCSRDLILERARKIAQGQDVPRRYEFTAISTQGREFEVEASVSYIPYQDGLATQGVLRDVTERKLAAESLRASEERFRKMAESIHDGLTIVQDRRVVYLNDRVCEIFGYSREELMHKTGLELAAPEDRERIRQIQQQVMSGGETLSELEFWIVRPNGERRCVRNRYSLGHSDQGASLYYIATTDVTEHRIMEERLRQSAKMEAVGRLAGGIAHDFNNLLTAIGGYTDLLLGERTLPFSMRDDLNQIKEAADRAAALTRQLLAFSRKTILQPQALNLNQVLANMESILRRLIGEQIDLVIVPDANLGLTQADPSQIEQVILNLAVNARDAIHAAQSNVPIAAHGRIVIETTNTVLDDDYAYHHLEVKPGEYVLLMVSDTGVGMDAQVLAHLFEPFFTTKGVGKGTGLGLATVHGIIKQHGGHISAYSEPGHGAIFRVYLPRVDQEAQAESPVMQAAQLKPGSETILLAEDETPVLELAGRILRQSGYTVLEARHPDQAIQLCEAASGPIHLLITDMVMPAMSGRDLAARLTEHHPNLSVLYISGYTDIMIAHENMDMPTLPGLRTAFLQKPFTPWQLTSQVRELLDPPAAIIE